jgi:myo-inositol-1(or 4)-monophosphatase
MSDLALAEQAARRAGGLLAARFGDPASGVETKSSATDLVSDADRAAEEAILELLRTERPDDGLLSEEGGDGAHAGPGPPASGDGERRWVVDPLDGTTNFLYGLPAWCVSVALEDADGGLVGVVHDPLAGETFTAERGRGCRLNGRAVRIRDQQPLERALVATGFGYEAAVRSLQARALTTVLPRVRDLRRGGSAALDLAWLAAGRLDGYWELGVKPWDVAAGTLCVREAGGVVRPLDAEPPGLAAAGPTLLPALLGLLAAAG